MMFLAYFIWWLLASIGLPLWIALLLVLLSSVVLGLICERLFLRPLIGRSMLTTFMLCLFLGIFIKGAAILSWGGFSRAMPHIFPSGYLIIGNLSFSHTVLWGFIVAIALFLIFVFYFRYTRIGLGMRCVSEDHLISQSVGINVKRIFALSWVIGCIAAVISGIVLASVLVLDPTMDEYAIIRALPVLLLGGLESIPGALVGGLLIGVAESLSATYIDPHVTAFRELLPFILMVLIMMIRPQGLFGLKRIERI